MTAVRPLYHPDDPPAVRSAEFLTWRVRYRLKVFSRKRQAALVPSFTSLPWGDVEALRAYRGMIRSALAAARLPHDQRPVLYQDDGWLAGSLDGFWAGFYANAWGYRAARRLAQIARAA